MSTSRGRVFTNPSIQRFTRSALAPLESTGHYLGQLSHLLHINCAPENQPSCCATSPAKVPSTFMETEIKISLRTPVIKETACLARIHLAAFKHDRCIRLMYSDSSHWKAINAMIETRDSHIDYGMKVAITEGEGRIAGWLCCSIVEPGMPDHESLAYLEWTIAASRVVEIAEERLTKTSGIAEDKFHRDRRRRLCSAISEASVDLKSKRLNITSDTRYLIINTLVIDPPYQGRGVGSELLRWATDNADRDEVAIWAQVPAAALGVFETAGFEEVHNVILDLDEYYYGKEDGSKQTFGSYEFRYMLRKANHAAKAG